jgi:hypothetical protein
VTDLLGRQPVHGSQQGCCWARMVSRRWSICVVGAAVTTEMRVRMRGPACMTARAVACAVSLLCSAGMLQLTDACPGGRRAQVLDLADPVEDEVGYVYEKAAIVKYIRDAERRRPGQPVDCPIAGAPPAAARLCCDGRRCQGRGGADVTRTRTSALLVGVQAPSRVRAWRWSSLDDSLTTMCMSQQQRRRVELRPEQSAVTQAGCSQQRCLRACARRPCLLVLVLSGTSL